MTGVNFTVRTLQRYKNGNSIDAISKSRISTRFILPWERGRRCVYSHFEL
jgi:hypothetical protein